MRNGTVLVRHAIKEWFRAASAPLACLALVAIALPPRAQAQSYSVVYNFCQGGNYNDGQYPYGDLIEDSAGNLYGTTYDGGAYGGGTVYEISASGAETVLHSFAGSPVDGARPTAGLVLDAAGNMYGTASAGGAYDHGAVFQVSASGAETLLYSFKDQKDEGQPLGGLFIDPAGNLYGTTSVGSGNAGGTAFKLFPSGKMTELHTFAGAPNDGAHPEAGLIHDSARNLYGTTSGGGTYEEGTVCEISNDGTEALLYSFTGGSDGATPAASLTRDAAGNLYGTAASGGIDEGSQQCDGTFYFGCGTVFEVTPSGQESVLYTFTGGTDGGIPLADLVMDAKANLYGTASVGGSGGSGVVFEVSPAGKEKVLHSFFANDPTDGRYPYGGLLHLGNYLYGTTNMGGAYDCGTVYRITP